MMKANGKVKKRTKTPLSIIPQLQELCQAGEAVTVTVHRKKFKIEDAKTFEKLLDFVDWVETVESIREGLRDVEAGRCISIAEAKEHLARKYGVPS